MGEGEEEKEGEGPHIVLVGLSFLHGVESGRFVVYASDLVDLGLLLHESFVHLKHVDKHIVRGHGRPVMQQ